MIYFPQNIIAPVLVVCNSLFPRIEKEICQMGDSSVSCCLTGHALTWDRAVLIPLAPSRNPENGDRGTPSFPEGSRIISNHGARGIFMPLTMPIFGKLNGYGCLEDIEEDDHTMWLEKRLKMWIYDFARAVCYGEDVPKIKKIAQYVYDHDTPGFRERLKWDGVVRGCFVAREAWDKFSAKTWDECGAPNSSAYDDGWVDQNILAGMGFVKGTKNVKRAKVELGSEGDRYHTPYTHSKLSGLTVWCDESMSSEATYLGSKIDTFYKVKDFVRSLRKVGLKLPSESVKWAKSNTSMISNILTGKEEYELYRDIAARSGKEKFRRISIEIDQSVNKKFSAKALVDFSRIMNAREATDVVPVAAEEHHDTQEKEDIDVGILETPYSETLCGLGFHVKLTANSIGGEASLSAVEKVDHKESCKFEFSFVPSIKFTDETWKSLREAGYKDSMGNKPRFHSTLLNRALSGFTEEFVVIYRSRLFSEDTIKRMVSVNNFCNNMTAANKLLQPTNCGYQYGHAYAEKQVAEMSLMLAKRKIAEMKK